LVFGSDGYLFVANDANSTVTEYAPGKNVVVRTISQGVNAPFDLAFGP
jgi:DNA-binding beta-propeller fold protein YncE